MSNAREIAQTLGRKNIQNALGVKSGAVSAAVVRGQFPASWFHEMEQLALAANMEMPRHLFNWRRGNGRRKAMGP